MRRLSGILMGVALTAVTAGPLLGQADTWQRKWYWGAQTGILLFQDATGTQSAFNVGGHWLITGTRSAFWLAFDQMFFPSSTTVVLNDGTPTGTSVSFTDGRRIQGALLAVPTDGALQIYAGIGFAIHDIQDPVVVGTSLTPETALDLAENNTTKAFALLMAGFQLRMGRNLALFANYQLMPGSEEFLIQSDQHTLMAGLRLVLSSAHEDVTTRR